MRAPTVTPWLLLAALFGCGDGTPDSGADSDQDEDLAKDANDMQALAAVCQSVNGFLAWQDGSFRCVIAQAERGEAPKEEDGLRSEAEDCRRAGFALVWSDAGFECVSTHVDAGLSPDAGVATDADASQSDASAGHDAGKQTDCPQILGWLCNGVQAGTDNGNGNGNHNGSGNDVTIIGIQIGK